MRLRCIAFLLILGYALAGKVSYRNFTVYKITPKNEEALKVLTNLESQSSDFSRYQFWQGPTKVGHEVSMMVAPELKENLETMLEDLDVDKETMIEDVQAKIDVENPLRRRTAGPFPVDWTAYNTLDEINAWLEDLAVTHSNDITILRPGKSHQGRDIVGVKLDYTPETEKPVVFVEANIHAREWITAATATYILNELINSNDVDSLEIATSYTWYIFPVMNPDGYVYSHETDRMWRKTRTRYNIFCYGADPNRNWGYRWMEGGASTNPCSDLYAGPHPFSESSVKVMSEFIATIADRMVAYLDFHSFSQMLLLPYGHTTDHIGNYAEMKAIGDIAMNHLASFNGTQYVVGNIAETIYKATGSSMDWVKGTYDTPIAYTYELRDKGLHGFLLPADQIKDTAHETFQSVISILTEYEARHPRN